MISRRWCIILYEFISTMNIISTMIITDRYIKVQLQDSEHLNNKSVSSTGYFKETINTR